MVVLKVADPGTRRRRTRLTAGISTPGAIVNGGSWAGALAAAARASPKSATALISARFPAMQLEQALDGDARAM